MKNVFRSVIPLALVLVVGCKKKDSAPTPQDCAANAVRVSETAVVYTSKLDQPSCDLYKKALRDYVNSCAAVISVSDKKYLDEEIAKPCVIK